MFDLTRYDTKTTAERGIKMPILLPDGTPAVDAEGAPVTITLAGQDSDTYRKAERTQRNRILERASRQRKYPINAEQQEEDAIEILTACTIAWSGLGENGEALPCTPEVVRRVYRHYPFIREQVDAFIAERRNFLPG